jgi:hypothetical protein
MEIRSLVSVKKATDKHWLHVMTLYNVSSQGHVYCTVHGLGYRVFVTYFVARVRETRSAQDHNTETGRKAVS